MAVAFALPLGGHDGRKASVPGITMAVDAVLDTAYPVGGYLFDPAEQVRVLGNYDKAPIVLSVLSENKGNFIAEYDRVNGKLLVRLISTGLEAAGDLSVIPGTLRLVIHAK